MSTFDQQGNTLVKRLWLNVEQSALCAPSVSPILIQKGFKSSKGDFRANNSRVFLFAFFKTKHPKPQSARTVGGIQSLHTRLVRIQHQTVLLRSYLAGPRLHSGQPTHQRANSATLNEGNAARHCFPKTSLQRVPQ